MNEKTKEIFQETGEENKFKVSILPRFYIDLDGTFCLEEAMRFCGQIAGVCHDTEGLSLLLNEPKEKTMRRVPTTLQNDHLYDHISISFLLQNIPKILAMVLNNESQYTTRYTPVEVKESSIITDKEVKLYQKWLDIFKVKIKKSYGSLFKDSKIQKLAQENARYFVSIFMPTEMVYSTTFRQINDLASWLKEYIQTANQNDPFEKKLASSMQELIDGLYDVCVLEDRFMKNEKHRKLSLFGKDLEQRKEYFGDVYSTVYKGSFALLAQGQKYQMIDYQMERLTEKEYFIPPILLDDPMLVYEWLHDMQMIQDVYPQGELVNISETGKYDDFILKCKEKLCSSAQLEIMLQTKKTLFQYKKALEDAHNPLASDIINYTHGARCTFPDYECSSDCKFKEGKTLARKI